MENIVRRPFLSADGRRSGTSYLAGEIELHLPPEGRAEVYVGGKTIDAGLLVTALSDIARLFDDPIVPAQVIRACKGA